MRKPSRQASTAGRRASRSASEDSIQLSVAVTEEDESTAPPPAPAEEEKTAAQKIGISIAGELNSILKAPSAANNKALSAAAAATGSGGGGDDADDADDANDADGNDDEDTVPELDNNVLIKPKPVPKGKRMSMNIAAELNAKMLGGLGAGGLTAGLKSASEANPKQKQKKKAQPSGPALVGLI